MKTIRAMFFWVAALFNIRKPFPVVPIEMVETTEMPVVDLKSIYSQQQDILDTTLMFIRRMPKNQIDQYIAANYVTLVQLNNAIETNKAFDPTILGDAIEFCHEIRSWHPLN